MMGRRAHFPTAAVGGSHAHENAIGPGAGRRCTLRNSRALRGNSLIKRGIGTGRAGRLLRASVPSARHDPRPLPPPGSACYGSARSTGVPFGSHGATEEPLRALDTASSARPVVPLGIIAPSAGASRGTTGSLGTALNERGLAVIDAGFTRVLLVRAGFLVNEAFRAECVRPDRRGLQVVRPGGGSP